MSASSHNVVSRNCFRASLSSCRWIFLFVSLLVIEISLSHALTNLRTAGSCPRLLTALSAKSRARNKQTELAEKLARAKQQQQQPPPITGQNPHPATSPEQETSTSTDEFAKLLSTTRGALPRKGDSFDDEQSFLPDIQAGKIKQKVVKKKKAPAPLSQNPKKNAERIHFEALINVETNKALGAMGAAELVPWVPPFLVDKLIVVCDPRQSSADLRAAVQYLKGLENTRLRVVGITADAPQQAKGWWGRLKASEDDESSMQLFADPDLQWMTAYKVVVWSLTLLVFDTDGVVTRLESNVDPSRVVSMVQIEEDSSRSK